jgi:demethylmenaquinone methyltransferase/2-methoxy-6-polyprenyl-1,4-benzoquinol methylase
VTALVSGDEPLTPAMRRLLAEQAAYYAARAPEYDATAYTADAERADTRIAAVLDGLRPFGNVLEVACGTGRWTASLARRAASVLAVDAAEPALAIAGARLDGLANVTLDCADVWDWDPAPRLFDEVVMAFWLSHVPRSLWHGFLRRCAGWARPGGRIVVIDEHQDDLGNETWVDRDREIVRRTLRDGSTYRIVKAYVQPDRLKAGFDAAALMPARLAYDGAWLVAAAVTRRR